MVSSSVNPIALTPNAPQFQHDCDCCHFLGRHVDPDTAQPMDLYAHASGKIPTVIARTGPLGDYMSGLDFSYGRIAALTEARRRAEDAGVLTYNLRAALIHTTMQDREAYAELQSAITVSPEWAALLAYEALLMPESQAQFNALIEAVHSEHKENNDSVSRLSACFEVTNRLDKMIQIMRDWNPWQSMQHAQASTDFVWKNTNLLVTPSAP